MNVLQLWHGVDERLLAHLGDGPDDGGGAVEVLPLLVLKLLLAQRASDVVGDWRQNKREATVEQKNGA